jgi:hypothetical protein
MIDGLRYVTIPDPERHGDVLVAYPPPREGDPWGVLRPLMGTSWGAQIPTVTGEALSHALHGRPKPLREMLGPPPLRRTMRIALEERVCLERQQGICAMAAPHCMPGTGRMPECYVPPAEDRALRAVATAVAHAWDEGRYVFLVDGPEFVVT